VLKSKVGILQYILRTGGSQGMLAVFRCRLFSLPVCYPKL